jgi:hypothetical protein
MAERSPVHDQHDTVEVLTVEEAAARYVGEWVLMEVTDAAEDHTPRAGIVVDHRPNRDDIQDTALRALKSLGQHPHDYYLFYGARYFRTGEEWAAYREATSRRGGRRGRR